MKMRKAKTKCFTRFRKFNCNLIL